MHYEPEHIRTHFDSGFRLELFDLHKRTEDGRNVVELQLFDDSHRRFSCGRAICKKEIAVPRDQCVDSDNVIVAGFCVDESDLSLPHLGDHLPFYINHWLASGRYEVLQSIYLEMSVDESAYWKKHFDVESVKLVNIGKQAHPSDIVCIRLDTPQGIIDMKFKDHEEFLAHFPEKNEREIASLITFP